MNKLRYFREKNGYTRAALAELIDTTETSIYRKETGIRPLFWADALKIAPHLNCLPEELMGSTSKELTHVPVVRYLRKLAVTEASLGGAPEMAGHAGFAAGAVEATRVVGDANHPFLYEGWYIFNGEFFPGVPDELILQPCVVELLNTEEVAIAHIHKGDGMGRYNLIPIGHKIPIKKNVGIARSAKILAITPG